MVAARPLRARGATGALDAKLSSSESEPTKPSDSSSSELHAAAFLAAFFGGAALAALTFAGAGLVATGLGGAGFGFGAAGAFLGAGFFFCFAPVRRRRVSQVPNV